MGKHGSKGLALTWDKAGKKQLRGGGVSTGGLARSSPRLVPVISHLPAPFPIPTGSSLLPPAPPFSVFYRFPVKPWKTESENAPIREQQLGLGGGMGTASGISLLLEASQRHRECTGGDWERWG